MSSFVQLKAQALALGLSGADVAQYVVQQQNGEREERAREREERLAKIQAEKSNWPKLPLQRSLLLKLLKPGMGLPTSSPGYMGSCTVNVWHLRDQGIKEPGNSSFPLIAEELCSKWLTRVHSLAIFPTGRQKTKCDASNFGLGAVLLQYINGTPHPVAFASRKLVDRKRRYATTEKKALAIIFGVKKFDFYLRGKEFLLETDHKPLVYLQYSRCSNDRVMRWAL
ncbi:hypothetical protein Pcinc_001268 [Petrolisthes cinctipes]|uniref:Reverse transcriptase RNase H-like domain-containing protein n=1 Tax=Petrolisthes cinctipes TaxID=88211 RepID=A0AAE1GLL2_PETCI|nr:hypothetical protein Pcinc_001268 [Petrolisthes cinctipes]